ncbi:hypothetical protein [Halosimplex marinum]|uniref:hypothetical protein n=1 Tax=Halosimplex marinum TaxID=3396620 RepID=UPI003F57375F
MDIIGATVVAIADLPSCRKDFVNYCPRTKHVEKARIEMTTKTDGQEVWLREGEEGYNDISEILEQYLEREVSGDIRSNRVGRRNYVISVPNGVEYRDSTLRRREFSELVREWEARYIRRLGLGLLLIGFSVQIVATLL